MMPKETGILFSAPMVLATLRRVKDVTRRTRGLEKINEHPDPWVFLKMQQIEGDWYALFSDGNQMEQVKSPYGGPGDLLYGKETWAILDGKRHFLGKIERARELGLMVPGNYHYRADAVSPNLGPWRPSIFMPKEAARIWRKIVSVRPERLHEITGGEAKREGIVLPPTELYPEINTEDKLIQRYRWLWDSLNGEGAWDRNDWVWRIESVEYQREQTS